MIHPVCRFWNDQEGFVLTAETVMLGSVLVIGVIAGVSGIRTAVLQELNDVACAIGSLDQSFFFGDVRGHCAFTAGSFFHDTREVGDVSAIVVCAEVAGPPLAPSALGGPPVVVAPDPLPLEVPVALPPAPPTCPKPVRVIIETCDGVDVVVPGKPADVVEVEL